MPSVLTVYNAALRHCGSRRLASLTENVEARHALDDAYDAALKFMLERGFWNFAIRTIEATAGDETPQFGYSYAFEKPVDWCRTLSITSDGHGATPVRFIDERGFWHADYETLFVRYVSNAAEYGANASGWPQTFAEALSIYLATQVVERLTQSDSKLERLLKMEKRATSLALSRDAMDEPPGELPRGGWASSRAGAWYQGR